MKPVHFDSIDSRGPQVGLVGPPLAGAYDQALAAGRTCYSPRAMLPADVADRHRQDMGPSLIAAGHHTVFQHGHATFVLERVSRHFVWSFLHSHPFYNSEQQSQRYVEMDRVAARVPAGLSGEALDVYHGALAAAWEAYERLGRALLPVCRARMAPLARVKGLDDKAAEREATKKAIELARYALPLAAHTALHHTVSLLDLARYQRVMAAGECAAEATDVVGQMVALVRAQDPLLAEKLFAGPLPAAALPETAAPAPAPLHGPGDAAAAAFDASMAEGQHSRLVACTPGAEALVAGAVRETLGLTAGQLGDADALDLVLDPARNPLLLETMNLWMLSPSMRALEHARFTFAKRLSHTADSQDQRHRVVPASRPVLARCHTSAPDAVTPALVAADPEALAAYRAAMDAAWAAKNRLLDLGVAPEDAVLVLPNAVRVRHTQSGSMLGLLHKWRMRTCFCAQEEIFEASMQELAQAADAAPGLCRRVGPPCVFRRGRVPDDGRRGPCPEGERWCGVAVWLNFPKVKRIF